MRSRDGEPPGVAVVGDREIEHVGGDIPDVDDLYPFVGDSFDGRFFERWGREAHVASDHEFAGFQIVAKSCGDLVCSQFVYFLGIESSDIVGFEYLIFHMSNF